MSEIARMFVTIGADVASFKSGMRDATGAASDLTAIFRTGMAASLAADALHDVGRAIVGVAGDAIRLAGELEQSKVAFTTMLGSAKKADAFLRDLTKFAASTPFELAGLQDSSKKLLAFGFHAKDIIPIMTGVGNAVAGLGGGKETLDGITMALGQMAAKGKVSAEEMGQLAERGIPAWKMLADKIGKSVPEAMDLAAKGAIPGSVAIEALVNGMNERFPNMMAKQSQTLLGAWSNLQDGVNRTLTAIGGNIVKTFDLTGIVSKVGALMSGLATSLENDDIAGIFVAIKAAALGFATAVVASVAPQVFAAITTTMIPAIHALALAWAPAIAAALPYIGLAVAVAAAAVPIMNQWDDLKVMMADFWSFLKADAGRAWNAVRDAFDRMYRAGVAVTTSLGSWFRSLFGGLASIAGKTFDALPAPAQAALKSVGAAFSSMKVAVAGNLAPLPGLMSEAAGQMAGHARGLGGVIRNNLAYSWGGVGDSVRAVMGNVTAALAGATLEAQRLTLASTKGLDGAKKAGHQAKAGADSAAKALREAAKAMKEYEAATDRGDKALLAFSARAGTFTSLGKAMQDVKTKATELGGRFDANAAAADVYKKAIDRLKSQGFAETGVVLKTLTNTMKGYETASEGGTKATAEAYKVLDQAALRIEAARLKAELLGDAFDGTKVATDEYRGAIGQMVDLGLNKANPALVEATNKLAGVTAAAVVAKPTFDTFKASVEGTAQAASLMREGLATIGQALGASFLDPMLSAVGATMNLGLAVLQVVAAAPKVAEGIGAMVKAIDGSLGVWGLVAAGVGLVVGALVAFASQSDRTVAQYDQDVMKLATLSQGTGNALTDTWQRTTFVLGGLFESIGDQFRSIFKSSAEQERAIKKMAGAIQFARDEQKKFSAEVGRTQATFDDLNKSLSGGFSSSISGALKAFIDGTKPLKDSLREGVRDAITAGIIDGFMKKGVVEQMLGSQIQGLASAAARGDTKGINQVIAEIASRLPEVTSTLEAAFGGIKRVLDVAFERAPAKVAAPITTPASTFASLSRGDAASAPATKGGGNTHVEINMNVSNKDAGRELVKQLGRVGVVAT